jgi:hypothetical protein
LNALGERLGKQFGEEIGKQAGAAAGEGAALAMRHVGEAIVQGKKDFLRSFGYSFRYPIKRRGADVGTVHAQVNPQQLLSSVFARTRRRQGEVPFALDESGQLFAAASDRPRLETLRVADAVQAGKDSGVLKAQGQLGRRRAARSAVGPDARASRDRWARACASCARPRSRT